MDRCTKWTLCGTMTVQNSSPHNLLTSYYITHKYSEVCTHDGTTCRYFIDFIKMIKIPNYVNANIIIILIM